MFTKQLASAIRRACISQNISHEAASELCDISSRYFGSIVRGKSAPSINTLEKLCHGFDKTPNELLGLTEDNEELSYRKHSKVEHYRTFRFGGIETAFAVCPRWHGSGERDYQTFCDQCGQKLDWDDYGAATSISRE